MLERVPELVPDRPSERVPEPTGAPWSPHDRPGPDFERVLDARTPLLARAFEGARQVDDSE